MQCALERRQRPGGRPVALAIRLAVELAQDALLGGCVVQDGWPTSVAWLERRQPLMIEQTDQRRDGVARPPPSQIRGLNVRVAIRHCEQNLRARDQCGWQAERSTHALQVRPLLRTQPSERLFLNSRHGYLRRREKPAHKPVLAQLDRNAKSRDI